MLYDRFARILHLLIAVGVLFQVSLSLVMVHPKPGRLGDLFYEVHEELGQVLLFVLVVHWLWRMMRPGQVAVGLLFPWFSGVRYQAIFVDIKRYVSHARRFCLPDSGEQVSPLASAVQGLGLLAATLLGISGVVLFLGIHPDGSMVGWVHDIKEIHEFFGSLMWIYLVVHAGMGIVHQLAGHDALGGMVRVWK